MLAHQAGGLVAQRHHAGAGQRGHVHQCLGVEAFGVGQRIAQDQAAFGVGIADFDGLAGHAGDHVGGAVGVAVDGVLDRRHHHHQIDRQLGLDRGHEGADDVGATAHVVLHFLDAALRLEVDATGVEGDALADQHVGARVAAAIPLQHDQARAVGRATCHRQQRTHAERFHLRLVQDLGLGAAELAGKRGRGVGQVGRGAVVRRQVAQLAGEFHAFGGGHAHGERAGVVAGNRQGGQAGFIHLLLAQRGGVAIGRVVADGHRLADVPGCIAGLDGEFGQGEQGGADRAGLQRPGRIADGLEVRRHAELAGFAQADHQHARRGDAGQVVQQCGAAGLAGHVAARDQGRQTALAGAVQRLGSGRKGLVGEHANHDAVDGSACRRVLVQGELQGH